MRFASRTAWNLELNRLARLAEERRRAGRPILDLTESNPTLCGFRYDEAAIREALADPRGLTYEPQPRGLDEARQAVCEYYGEAGISTPQVLLTSGSSEAYGHLFRLLADPGDQVLAPRPSYPLLGFLAELHDVQLAEYALEYHGGWAIDFASLEQAAGPRTRAVVAVNPNNPTGSLVKPEERERLLGFCARHGMALIADEVFLDYPLEAGQGAAGSFASGGPALVFVLNGLSKTAALPQLKLGWMVAAGPPPAVEEAMGRLEIIADTYLSVGSGVQLALGRLLAGRGAIQKQILDRATSNLAALDRRLEGQSLVTRLGVEAGWSVILRLPRFRTDEEWALELLDEDGVLAHPGHFFHFPAEAYLVLSLIVEPASLEGAIERLLERVARHARLS